MDYNEIEAAVEQWLAEFCLKNYRPCYRSKPGQISYVESQWNNRKYVLKCNSDTLFHAPKQRKSTSDNS